MSGIFLNSIFDRMSKLMSSAVNLVFSPNNHHRNVSDLIDDLNIRIIAYDSELGWGNIERSILTEKTFLKEIEELEKIFEAL